MMKRRRWIRPEFFSDEDVLALPIPARQTFLGLMLYADPYGRERVNTRLMKAAVWPLDDEIKPETVEDHLVLLAERGLIRTYGANGREYFEISWDGFIPDKDPAISDVPAPTAMTSARIPESAPIRQRALSASSAGRQRKEREGGGWGEGEGVRESSEHAGEGGAAPPAPFCPRHPSGTDRPCKPCGNARLAFRAWQAQREYETEGETT